MVNLDYDFLGVAPWVVPYIGVGIGYQRARLNDFSTVPADALQRKQLSDCIAPALRATAVISAAARVEGIASVVRNVAFYTSGTRSQPRGVGCRWHLGI